MQAEDQGKLLVRTILPEIQCYLPLPLHPHPPFSGGATEFRLIVALLLPQAFVTGSPKAPATGFENLMGYAGNHHRFR